MSFYEKKPHKDDNDTGQEHKNGNAVNAMHITHPPGIGRIWVSFLNVEIFCDLSQYTHEEVI
jgi:hypothetical protein